MASMLFQTSQAPGVDYHSPTYEDHHQQPYQQPHQYQQQEQYQAHWQESQQQYQYQLDEQHNYHHQHQQYQSYDDEPEHPTQYQTMSYHQSSSATYLPGGYDDYYMPPESPALAAPAPQRHMPEMSDHIQEGMANINMNRESTISVASTSSQSRFDYAFPAVLNRTQNVPATDEVLETTLEGARNHVLTSNDPEMQLAWAQDALVYAGAAIENEERLSVTQPPRPSTPHIERQIRTDAVNVVSFLADQRHPKAEFMRGTWYEFGRFGVGQDKKEAFRCYARATDKGYARAEYRLGMLYEAANDPIKALKHYHRGKDQGDSACLYRLGMMTLRGQHGQVQDFAYGVDLIARSADCADENAPQGAYVYGMLLARQLPQIQVPDTVLEFDEPKARHYIENAAFLRFSKAQLKMGSCYELAALGCSFDPALSLHYNRLASRQGEAEADMAISKWFLVGHEGLFPKNEELAYIYANRAAHTGLSNAEFAMGYFNELGIYIPKNLDIALEWYKKAANDGNPDAPGRIDGLSRKQVLSRKDHEKVAISRITSQRGSLRGGRPERFSKGHPPRGSSLSGQIRFDSPQPPRVSSAAQAPYPMNDRPPTVPPGPPRASSVAPYPVDENPLPMRPATTLPIRSSSAFSINPEIRPSSSATMGDGHQRPQPGPINYGRPSPVPGSYVGGRRLPQQRAPSMPVSRPTSSTPMSNQPSHQNSSSLDIGFVAPVDSRPRPQGIGMNDSMGTPPPQPMRESPRPPRSSSIQNLGSQNGTSPAPTPTATPKPAAPASQSPPKKGPQTFDQMGVPAAKQDSECIVM